MKYQYSEEKIISILNVHQVGASVHHLARCRGILEYTLYRWKSTRGGMEVSEAKRLSAGVNMVLGLLVDAE